MKKLNLKCMIRDKKYHSYKGKIGQIVPNFINRNFTASAPNQIGHKLYLSSVLDIYNGEIFSYNISEHLLLSQVMDMLNKAFKKIPNNESLILHSDQGWQYQHKQYQLRLKAKGIHHSMSRKGNCLDNSIMENFFGLLKSELFYLKKFATVEEFKIEFIKYIAYYNNKRIKSKLKGLSPV